MNEGISMMSFDTSTYAAEKVGGYVPVVKQDGNVKIPLSELASAFDVDKVAIFEGTYTTANPTDVSGLPSAQSVRDAVDAGKIVVLHLTTPPSPGPASHYYYWLVSNETYVLHFLDLNHVTFGERYLDLRTSDNAWLVNTYVPPTSPVSTCFVEPIIFSGTHLPAYSYLDIGNIVDGYGVALIGLMAPSGMSVKTGEVYELMFNCYPYIGTYPVSLALFKLTGHPCYPSDDPSVTGAPLKFRRLTSPIAPRELTGICNDFGIGANGNPSYAANPVRFTFEEDVDFDAGDLIYVGIALAYNSAYQDNVAIMASPLKAVKQYNNPSQVVMPAYYIFGTSDKIDSAGFSAKEFTAGYGGSGSGYDFSLSSGFGQTSNILEVTGNGIVTSSGSACPVQMKLMKVQTT